MNKTKGFTLIELLVVVAIIALLVAILVPAVQRAKEQANRAVCATRLKGMDTAAYLYAETNNAKFPIGYVHEEDSAALGEWESYASGTDDLTPQDSFALLVHLDYLPTKLLLCPSVGGNEAPDEWELVGVGASGTLHEGEPLDAAEAYIHYAYQDIDTERNSTFTKDRENYLASMSVSGNWPMFGDRGYINSNGNYEQGDGDGNRGSGNHSSSPGMQNVIGGAHGVVAAQTETTDDALRPNPAAGSGYSDETDSCMVGYSDAVLYDNIYEDDDQDTDANDTYLLYRE